MSTFFTAVRISSCHLPHGEVPSQVVDKLRLGGPAGAKSDIAIRPHEIQAGRACAIRLMRVMLRIAQPGEIIRRNVRRVLRTDDEVSSNQFSARLSQAPANARKLRLVGSRAAPL